MGRFSDALKAGRVHIGDEAPSPESLASLEPRVYVFGDKALKCVHCRESLFLPSAAVLGRGADAAQSLEWNVPVATNLVCAECGRIESFVELPDTAMESVASPGGSIDLSRIPDLD